MMTVFVSALKMSARGSWVMPASITDEKAERLPLLRISIFWSSRIKEEIGMD